MLRARYFVATAAIGFLIVGASARLYSESQSDLYSTLPDAKDSLTISNDLTAIILCGEVYRSGRVLVNNIEIVSRIAEAAKEARNNFICENVKNNRTADMILTVSTRDMRDQFGGLSFYVSLGTGVDFNIDPDRNVIEYISSFDRQATFLASLKEVPPPEGR